MSDTFDGVVVEYFDIDAEKEKVKQDIEDRDIEYQMDDSSDTDFNWVETRENNYLNSFGY